MTLLDKWKLYMADNPAPDHFIEFGFYYMIGSALQRRVWLGPPQEGKSIFPNMYIILCGEPGVGKGIVIKPVAEILKYHKITGGEADAAKQDNVKAMENMIEEAKKNGADQSILEALYKSRDALTSVTSINAPTKKERLLIPVAADSTTYESLVQTHAGSVSKMTVKPCEKAPAGFYVHHSLCFALEEISSLFKKRADAIVNYLIVAYDCGDYTYETKHAGTDRVRKCCLSFFGGTTPGFMKSAFDESLLSEGFASRTWFIFGHEARQHHFMFPQPTSEQVVAKQDIIARVKELTALFGQATFSVEAQAFCDNYFQNVLPKRKSNPLDVLKPYYSRKNIHLCKLCLAMHFAKSDEMEIQLATVERALSKLDSVELSMHHALAFSGRNPLGLLYKKVWRWLAKDGAKTMIQIWEKYLDDMTIQETEQCVEFLMATGKLDVNEVDKAMQYSVKENIKYE